MAAPRRLAALLLAPCVAAGLAACGKTIAPSGGGGPSPSIASPVGTPGAVSVATRNTTRLGGDGAAADAAAVVRAVYPGLTAQTRPTGAVVVDERDWSAALAASVFAGSPPGAPLLYSRGGSLPAVTRETLEAVRPAGLSQLGGVQVIEAGASAPLPSGMRSRLVTTTGPAATAAAFESLLAAVDGSSLPHAVIVVSANAPRAMQMPAAGLAAESGAPILFVTPARIPPPTAAVIESLGHPSIYVIDSAAVGANTLAGLRRLGRVSVVSTGNEEGELPAAASENSIAVARYTDGSFGWGVKEPGHGLVFVNPGRPLDGPGAASLSASGDYAPALVLETGGRLPNALGTYLSDIQPAYTSAPQFRPVRGVYNHGWLIGDETAISAVTQAEVDALLEISPRHQTGEEGAVSQSE